MTTSRDDQLHRLGQVFAAAVRAGAALRGLALPPARGRWSPAEQYQDARARLRRLLEEGRGQEADWTSRFDPTDGASAAKAALMKVAKVVYSFHYPAAERERDAEREAEAQALLGQAAWDIKQVLDGFVGAAHGRRFEAGEDWAPELHEVWPVRPDSP